MSVQERLQHLTAELPESDLVVAERLLRGLQLTQDVREDPLITFLDNCPEDDEPYTEDERLADEHAVARYESGQRVSHEEVIRRTLEKAE